MKKKELAKIFDSIRNPEDNKNLNNIEINDLNPPDFPDKSSNLNPAYGPDFLYDKKPKHYLTPEEEIKSIKAKIDNLKFKSNFKNLTLNDLEKKLVEKLLGPKIDLKEKDIFKAQEPTSEIINSNDIDNIETKSHDFREVIKEKADQIINFIKAKIDDPKESVFEVKGEFSKLIEAIPLAKKLHGEENLVKELSSKLKKLILDSDINKRTEIFAKNELVDSIKKAVGLNLDIPKEVSDHIKEIIEKSDLYSKTKSYLDQLEKDLFPKIDPKIVHIPPEISIPAAEATNPSYQQPLVGGEKNVDNSIEEISDDLKNEKNYQIMPYENNFKIGNIYNSGEYDKNLKISDKMSQIGPEISNKIIGSVDYVKDGTFEDFKKLLVDNPNDIDKICSPLIDIIKADKSENIKPEMKIFAAKAILEGLQNLSNIEDIDKSGIETELNKLLMPLEELKTYSENLEINNYSFDNILNDFNDLRISINSEMPENTENNEINDLET